MLTVARLAGALLASESVSSGIWWWRLAVAALVVLTLACAAGFVLLLRRSKPAAQNQADPATEPTNSEVMNNG